MKITAGLGSIDDYIPFIEAGAEEVFCGYVPEWWSLKYGIYSPMNRREVLYYNVQIGSESEMEILKEMMEVYQVPVWITLNALSYLPEQYSLLLCYIQECVKIGFFSFIIADYGLLIYLLEHNISKKIQIAVSGEMAEMNSVFYAQLQKMGVHRIIFHRKMTIKEMQNCFKNNEQDNMKVYPGILEREAFLLNEKCHFHGAFCNSLHCDELAHICKLPYCLTERETGHKTDKMKIFQNRQNQEEQENIEESGCSDNIYIPGSSGCGLCALWDMQEAGITHLKVVGRGNYSEDMEADIRAAAKAIKLLEKSRTRQEYINLMKRTLFPNGCSGNCYYENNKNILPVISN